MANPFEEAMKNTLTRIGEEIDEDLITYNKLKPHHFQGLTRRYGFENVQRYIKIMESKRKGIPRLGER